uniref:Uncharacterized protein n=1 Tax=Arundo donax TaxID=35708 RepID=A0A0A9GJM2_ARUDO
MEVLVAPTIQKAFAPRENPPTLLKQSYSPSDCTDKGHLFLQEKQNIVAFPFHVPLLQKSS